MAEIFKAYDIRGIYGQDLNEETAYKLGRAFVEFLKCRKVVVGYDMRESSKSLFENLSKGIIDQGADVINIGLCSTPMSYFANGNLGADGSVMITASHNPQEYNGFKLCREDAIPLSGKTGIMEIKELVEENDFPDGKIKGKIIINEEIKDEYIKHISSFAKLDNKFKVVIDCANAMGIKEMEVLKDLIDIIPMYDEYDGSFPNHEANPLKFETMRALQERVVLEKADLGVSFDGDADRAGFVDEKGSIIPMDLVTGLIAEDILSEKKVTILYDLRSSDAVKEIINEKGGKAIECRVGHAFIKQEMRDNDAYFAGELSGHYYFKDNYTTESSSLAVIYLLNLMEKSGRKISDLVKPLRRYHQSGEINSKVEDTKKILDKLEGKYSQGTISYLDGLKISFDDWWFNVRASNTEPLLRLNLEGHTKEIMEEKRDEVLAIIRG